MPRTITTLHKLNRAPAPPFQLYRPSPTAVNGTGRAARVACALVGVLRPRQWIKNTACLAGLIFSGALFHQDAQLAALTVTAMFCAGASGIYILNDLCDRNIDRQNPRTADRPIASGALPVGAAVVGCLCCLAISGILACHLGHACAAVLGVYLTMNLAYSFWLKHAVLVDVMIIALGFVCRVLAGVYAIHAQPTVWIVLCVFFLALLLAVAKRRGELAAPDGLAAFHRPVLAQYTLPFLDVLMSVTATMTIACYALYTVETRAHNASLVVTVPPVAYGIARYLLLVMGRRTEAAEEILTRDKGLIAAVLSWVGLCVLIIYGDVHLFE